MASVDLPVDVLEIILLRLAAKLLARCKSVCKSWNAIISGPRFSHKFINPPKFPETYDRFVELKVVAKIGEPDYESICLIGSSSKRLHYEEVGEDPFLETPFPVPVCSCNGIVLFHSHRHSRRRTNRCLWLWNPTNGKVTSVECPKIQVVWFRCGLYYDSDDDDDYKVVTMDSDSNYMVFSFKTGEWVRKRFQFPPEGKRCEPPIFHEGCFYFLWGPYGRDDGSVPKMEYFDAREHMWKTMHHPNGLRVGDTMTLLSGRLCLYRSCRISQDRSSKLWIMEQAGVKREWHELNMIDQDGVFDALGNEEREAMWFATPVCLTMGQCNVVFHGDWIKSHFTVYDSYQNRFESADTVWKSSRTCIEPPKLIAYSETMAFPNNFNNNISNNINKRKREIEEYHTSDAGCSAYRVGR